MELIQKSCMNDDDFHTLLQFLLKKVEVVSFDELRKYKVEAFEIAQPLDPDDTPFFACALAYPGCIIWTDDKRLKKQDKVKVLNTQEMLVLLRS